jgi:peptide-methionine (S)-S-oxide reductase
VNGLGTFRARELILGSVGLAFAGMLLMAFLPHGRLLYSLLLYPMLLGFALWLARFRRVDLAGVIGAWPEPREMLGILALVPAFTALNWGAAWMVFYPLSLLRPEWVRSWLERLDQALPETASGVEWFALLITAVGFAPVVEEFLFRGLLLQRWSVKWGPGRGILAATTAFAILHLSPVGIFFFGLGLAGIYLRTGSLGMAVLAHATNNLLAFTLGPLVAPAWDRHGDLVRQFQAQWPSGLVALAAGATVLWLGRHRILPAPGVALPCIRNRAGSAGAAPEVSLKEAGAVTELATLAGGCFWCLEAASEQLRGVERVVSGYAGGVVPDPDYHLVCSGSTGHAEVVQLTFDPAQISYRELLEVFFTIHDPTTLNRQGADIGSQYRSAIYFHSPDQQATALEVIRQFTEQRIWPQPIVTEVRPLDRFYPAEGYHQGYYRRNPSQPYCLGVVAPKVAKVRQKYAARLRG